MVSHPEPRRVEEALIDEYVATATCPKVPPQPAVGNLGQLHALFMHRMTQAEVQVGRDSVTEPMSQEGHGSACMTEAEASGFPVLPFAALSICN